MAESQELLDRKLRKHPSYLWTWERKHLEVNSSGESASFMGLLQHDQSDGYRGPTYWQNNPDAVCSGETEEGNEPRSEIQHFDDESLKPGSSAERMADSLKSDCEPSESAEELERTLHVEIQPFANQPISGADLITVVMEIRCCGLLRWELDPDEPHTPLALNLLAIIDKDMFDVQNLALELDQALLNFATCSVAIRSEGSKTNYFLVGGSKMPDPTLDDKTLEKPSSRLKSFFRSKPFFSSFISLKSSRSSSLRNIAAAPSPDLHQTISELVVAVQEISSELKLARKDIRDVQSHMCFLSRHISKVNLVRNKSSFDDCDHSQKFTKMYGLEISYDAKPNGTTENGTTYVAEKPNR